MSKDVKGVITWIRTFLDTIYESTSNKVTSWSGTTTDTHYPSEKLVKDSLDGKSDYGHNHNVSDIIEGVYTSAQVDSLMSEVAGDTATDVMDKIGMQYPLRNQTVYNISGQLINYWQGIMEYGLSAIMEDFIIDGQVGVYEISNYNPLPDLFYSYDGTNLRLLTPHLINISLSDTNPKIDSTITVTITLTDWFGNIIPYENLKLNANGTTVNLITNNNGVATYTYTCSTWGVCSFSVEKYTAYIKVTGWKEVDSLASGKVKVFCDGEMVSVQVNGSWSLTSATSNVLATIGSNYQPNRAVNCFGINTSNANRLYVWTNGSVTLYSLSSQTGSTDVACQLNYPLKSKMPS